MSDLSRLKARHATRHKTLQVVVWMSFGVCVLGGCAPATHRELFQEDPRLVRESLRKVLENIDWEFKEDYPRAPDPGMAWFLADMPLFGGEPLTQVPAFIVHKQGRSKLNNTTSYGMVFVESDRDGTAFHTMFEAPGGDASANAQLLGQLTRQEMLIARDSSLAFANQRKSDATFVLLNTLTPFLSTRYLTDGNPLFTRKRQWFFDLQGALGDLVAGSVFLASRIDKDADDRRRLGNIAIGIDVGYRLLALLNLTDVRDYNNGVYIASPDEDARATRRSAKSHQIPIQERPMTPTDPRSLVDSELSYIRQAASRDGWP